MFNQQSIYYPPMTSRDRSPNFTPFPLNSSPKTQSDSNPFTSPTFDRSDSFQKYLEKAATDSKKTPPAQTISHERTSYTEKSDGQPPRSTKEPEKSLDSDERALDSKERGLESKERGTNEKSSSSTEVSHNSSASDKERVVEKKGSEQNATEGKKEKISLKKRGVHDQGEKSLLSGLSNREKIKKDTSDATQREKALDAIEKKVDFQSKKSRIRNDQVELLKKEESLSKKESSDLFLKNKLNSKAQEDISSEKDLLGEKEVVSADLETANLKEVVELVESSDPLSLEEGENSVEKGEEGEAGDISIEFESVEEEGFSKNDQRDSSSDSRERSIEVIDRRSVKVEPSVSSPNKEEFSTLMVDGTSKNDRGFGSPLNRTGQRGELSLQDAAGRLDDLMRTKGNRQLSEKISFFLRDNQQGEIKLHLRPDNLGQVRIHLSLFEGGVSGRIVVENAAVRQVFLTHLSQIEENLQASGFQTAGLDVALGQEGDKKEGDTSNQKFKNSRERGEGRVISDQKERVANRYENGMESQLSLYA